jgi:hypothetical protein
MIILMLWSRFSRAVPQCRDGAETAGPPTLDGSRPSTRQQDGWWDYTDTVPVIATHLEHLRAKGPHGPI